MTEQFSYYDQDRGAIDSFQHSIGKIGDSDSVFDTFDKETFYEAIRNLDATANSYIGTHCWPGAIDIEKFNSVICVTTNTYRSRVYRWARSFYHYYLKSNPWQLSGMALIDKQRETAKNYLKPFKSVAGTINLEFSDVVDNTVRFKNLVNCRPMDPSMERWKESNKFLYDKNFWNSEPVQRYHEAEYESISGQRYEYW